MNISAIQIHPDGILIPNSVFPDSDGLEVEQLADGVRIRPKVENSRQHIYQSKPDVEREKAAFLAMHPELWRKYPQQHVAIYQGKLVDRADNAETLFLRVSETYPNEFVWMCRVEKEPLRIFKNHSIHIKRK